MGCQRPLELLRYFPVGKQGLMRPSPPLFVKWFKDQGGEHKTRTPVPARGFVVRGGFPSSALMVASSALRDHGPGSGGSG